MARSADHESELNQPSSGQTGDARTDVAATMVRTLEASELSYRLLVTSVTDYALYMLHPDGRVASWNVGAERAKGYRAEEIIGRHFEEFYTAEDRAAGLPQHNLEIARRQGSFSGEGWRLRKNGSRFWAHVVLDPIWTDDGTLLGFAKITRDLSERVATDERLEFMADHDPLTGLLNRTSFLNRLESSIERAKAGERRLAVIEMDLDQFKNVNDAHGHANGDCVLKELGRRLDAAMRDGEFVARTGSDEFMAFKDLSIDGSLDEFLERLRVALESRVALEHLVVELSCHMGVACFPDDAGDRDKLMDNASLALRLAKTQLRPVSVYEHTMGDRARERWALAADILPGIKSGQFLLHYQEQHACDSTRRITGYEALARWRHPQRGMVSPMEFIALAEEFGSIHALGDWALRTACEEAARWSQDTRVAVNLSPLQLTSADLVERVAIVLQQTGLDPHRLELEVTETALIADRNRALESLRELKAMGVLIALDDFGIGYSSLETLRTFPFDKVKIDRSFVTELVTSRTTKAFVKAILMLAKSLSMPVLAEGVETEVQMVLLEHEGCDEVQGFLFGRPATPEQLGINRLR